MKNNCWHNFILTFVLVFFLFACVQDEKQKELPFKSKEEYEQLMIKSHQAFVQKEKEKIERFIDSSGFLFKETGTGLRYHIYHETKGEKIDKGELAIMTYVLSSIDGDTLYLSPDGKVQEFLVDYDNVESGLHEGIKQMKIGEKALFILPTHLAHGVTGDQAAIPSQTTLIYNIHLLAKR